MLKRTRWKEVRRLFFRLGICWCLGVISCGTYVRQPRFILFEESASPRWFSANGPLLAEYLKTLPASAIGQPLKGILLSDGKLWLEGKIYLGEPEGLPEGLGVRLIDDGLNVIAYMWLDDGSESFLLDRCEAGAEKGLRARRAGGGDYAWQALRPEHGLVYSSCPSVEWLAGRTSRGGAAKAGGAIP